MVIYDFRMFCSQTEISDGRVVIGKGRNEVDYEI